MSNVLSWGIALEKGYEPRLYAYAGADVPTGEYEAVLDFKIWSKKPCTINCYFTEKDTGIHFRLSVFRRRSDEVYALKDDGLDFRECPVNSNYRVTVSKNNRGNAVLKQVELLGI